MRRPRLLSQNGPGWRQLWWKLLRWCWAGWFVLFLVFAWSQAELRSPKPTPLLEDRTGRYLAEANKDQDLGFWDLAQPLNPKMVEAILAAEDRRFRWFPGVDPIALVRAVVSELTGGRTQGGSTIAMQVVRIQSQNPRTWPSKVLEIATGFFLVLRHGHDRVLAHYLKIVPQGNRIHGVAYAARRYFHKPLEDISVAEAALLASLAQAPGKMNLFDAEGYERAKGRAQRVLAIVRDRGGVEAAEYESALQELDRKLLPQPEARPRESYHFVLRALEEDEKNGVLTLVRPRTTTLDPRIQAATQRTVVKLYEENAAYNVGNAAALVADRRTGEVLAYVGSYDYFSTFGNGGIDFIQVPRSSGSTIKPFLYALALEEGTASPATILADLPFAVLDPQGIYRPGNFDDEFLGPMLFRRALANSRNIPVLRILEGLGIDRAYRGLADLGLVREARGPGWYGYGLALGGLYLSLEDLVRAYGALANGGLQFPLQFFRDAPSAPRRLLSDYAARTVALALSDDTARAPSFPRGGPLDYPWPVAVKTGTSQGYRDAWALAFDDRYVAGIWLGDADNTPMNRVAGMVAAAGLKELLMALEPLQAQGIDTVPFAVPEGTERVEVCALSGEIAGPDCQNTSVERFFPRNSPRTLCTVHVRRPVDLRTGAPASRGTPPHLVAMRPFTVLGPEYGLWSLHRGLATPASLPSGPRVLKILSPLDGGRYTRDPETPRERQTLLLQVLASPAPPFIDWYVDGAFFQSSPTPFTARWPLSPGTHTIAARWPGVNEPGPEVTVTVR